MKLSNLLFSSLIIILFTGVYAALIPFNPSPETPAEEEEGEQEKEMQKREGNIWVSAYLATWQHNAGTPYSNWGELTTEDIDWDSFTHLFYFALGIGEDGRPKRSLNPEKRNNLNTDRLNDIVSAAQRNNKKVLISIGGSGNYSGFSSAIKSENRKQFINTIIEFITKYEFDGVDLDMEPIYRDDHQNYKEFVALLHTELRNIRTKNGNRPLITIAGLKGSSVLELYADIQEYVDQINLMTYDMAQAWEGWQAWHNSALSSRGMKLESTGGEMTSVESKVDRALEAGIEPYKLGIGIDFYGYIWHDVHYLGKWPGWPDEDLSIMERSGGVPYYELNERFNLEDAEWDPVAQTPYLNVEEPKAFVSYDDERSVQKKVQYAVEEGLGGVILWELGGGYVKDNPPGQRNPLLNAVKQELQQTPISP